MGRKEVQRHPGGQGWGGHARPYLQDKPIRAGAVILVHFVDDQEDDTGEEGQGKEDQHGDLWEEAEMALGLRRQLIDRCKPSYTQICAHVQRAQGNL